MNRHRILVIEDDNHIRNGLVDTLESEGYQVDECGNGEQALPLLKQGGYDLVLLDIMMPGKDGYTLCQEFRQFDKRTIVIMLTAKSQEVDKVLGLKLGADDYIAKPFGIHELLARVESALRRMKINSSETRSDQETLPTEMDFGGVRVNRKTYQAHAADKSMKLTSRELKLLEQFFLKPGEVLSRDSLLNSVWGIDYYGTTRTLDQHIAQLRKKLATLGANEILETVHGVGYRYPTKN